MRVRSNSYNQASHNEPGPLARIPSPDPDHIDGLHLHQHAKPNGSDVPAPLSGFIPPFAFEDVPRSESPERASPQPEKGFFNLANMNSSAPALSTMQGHPSPPPLTHRSATTPAKRLAFAANLSIYDTFSPNVYDRRSEPATCNRLTPALAQRIKEELNSYKMEEMEVHAASRVQCVSPTFLFSPLTSLQHAVFRMMHTLFSPIVFSFFFFSEYLNAIPIIHTSPPPIPLNQQITLPRSFYYTLPSECKTPCLPVGGAVHALAFRFSRLCVVLTHSLFLLVLASSSWTDSAGSAPHRSFPCSYMQQYVRPMLSRVFAHFVVIT